MKYVGTERFSPVIYGDDRPWASDYFNLRPDQITKEFIANGEYDIDRAWWLKQKDRCINGYTVKNATDTNLDVWIPGRYYFFLNFWPIRRVIDNVTNRKDIAPPKFLDFQLDHFLARERMQKEGKNLQIQKTRQRGFSELCACDVGYEFTFFAGSQIVIVSGEEKYTDNTMGMSVRGLDALINTQFYKERDIDQKLRIRSKNTLSEIYGRTANINTQVVSALSPSLIIFEEIGIWKKGYVKEVYGYVDPSLRSLNKRIGYAIFIGTGGDMDEGVADAEDMFYNPANFDCLEFNDPSYEKEPITVSTSMFIPAWKFRIIDKDGNSLKEESLKDIEETRSKKTGRQLYYNTITEPIYASESFSVSSEGFFGAEVIHACNARKAYIRTHREAQVTQRIRISWLNRKDWTKGVVWEYDPDGPFIMAEPPRLDENKMPYLNLYVAGTDSYDQDVALNSTSKGSCWIKKKFLRADDTANKYVAGVFQRPGVEEGGAERFFENTALLCAMYNARNLIEYSKIRIIDYYVKNGFAGLLMTRPHFVTSNIILQSKATNKYGIDPSTKIHWLKWQAEYLQDINHINECDIVELLEAWAKFRYDPTGKKYNCDITISTSLCEVAIKDEEQEMIISSSAKSKFKIPYYKRDHNGRLKKVYS